MTVSPTPRVSVHGGHSRPFCNHAADSLEEMVQAYIACGFEWVGITEHMPPASDAFLYPDEREAGLSAADITERFSAYVTLCRSLQQRYGDRIQIRVGMETEAYTGAMDLAERLMRQHDLDFFVGSVHHVHDVPIDMTRLEYGKAADAAGGILALYCHYFDLQHAMIARLNPPVVGHFDLIRIFDDRYPRHITAPQIWHRVLRNLSLIKRRRLILDYNLRALAKGAEEPYVSSPILQQAAKMGIRIIPGDDAHSVSDIGKHIDTGIRLLQMHRVDTSWRTPPWPRRGGPGTGATGSGPE